MVTNFFLLLVLGFFIVVCYICSSLTHLTSYNQINPISVKLLNANQVIVNYSQSVFSIKIMKKTQPIRMSTRTTRPHEYLKDYYCSLNVSNTFFRVKYPLNFILSYKKLSSSYKFFVMSFSWHVESNTYYEVVKQDYWRNGWIFLTLKSNQTWESALLPKNQTVIGCK